MYNNPFNRSQIVPPPMSWEDMMNTAAADIKSNPRLIFTPKHKDWRDIMNYFSLKSVDNIFESLPYEIQNDIYTNDKEAFESLSNDIKKQFFSKDKKKKTLS